MYKYFKRFIDIICALLGIIGTSPLWIIAIVGILVSDWGAIFYTSTRIGKGNKGFKMFKFRSMRVDTVRRPGFASGYARELIRQTGDRYVVPE